MVSDTDNRNLVEFWKQIYGIDISPDENIFTYPPSMCFFGSDSLLTAQGKIKYNNNTGL
jgi:hypothetical protein